MASWSFCVIVSVPDKEIFTAKAHSSVAGRAEVSIDCSLRPMRRCGEITFLLW
jgi:hypothetical protein